MNISENNNIFSDSHRVLIIISIAISVILINIFCYVIDFAVIIGLQLYYLPIILATKFYPKKGLFFSLGLIALSIIISVYFLKDPFLFSESLITAFMMAGVATILSFACNEMEKNEFKFKKLFKNNPNPLIAFSEEGIITDINDEFETVYGYKRELLKGENIKNARFFSEESQLEISKKFAGFKSGEHIKSFLVDIKINNPDNDFKKNIITFISYEKSNESEFSGNIMASFSDVTEHIEFSEKLKQSEKKYRELADLLPQTIAEADPDMKVSFINKKGLKTFGFTKEDIEKGVHILDYIIPENHKKAIETLDKLTTNKLEESVSEFTAIKKDGSKFPIMVYSNLITEKGKNTGIRLAIIDLTRLREAETALSASEKKLAKLMQNFSGMAYRCKIDNNFSAEYLSEGFYELTGYSQSDIIEGKSIDLKSIIHPEDFEKFSNAIQKSLKNNGHYDTRYRFLTAKGEERWVWDQGRVIKDDNGNPQTIEGIVSNITELVKTENALKEIEQKNQQYIIESLKEKEILLKEIHHRVKNNLQIIASILKLKDMQSDSQEMHEVLLDCRSRVFSMAMIHEKLYKSESLAKINFKDYISTLQMHLADEYGAEEKEIKMICDCDENIALEIDTAIPCGLIVNEIITNALKYAFDEPGGEIRIGFSEYENDSYRLVVKDNGKGFPESYDYENSESLGMQLIYNLTLQLEGTIEIKNDSGTEFIITIPKGMQKSVKL